MKAVELAKGLMGLGSGRSRKQFQFETIWMRLTCHVAHKAHQSILKEDEVKRYVPGPTIAKFQLILPERRVVE